MNIKEYLKEKQNLINKHLDFLLPKSDDLNSSVCEAMRYSVLSGGKRLRPILVLTSTKAVGGREEDALDIACAIEFIHTYSLIHDDLPAMDNDDLRRGKPTCHKKFGEAIAILAGDALLTLGFQIISNYSKLPPEITIKIIQELSKAIGYKGMIGGQTVDIESEGKAFDSSTLHYIHTHKTGALITASVKIGGLIGNCSKEKLKKLAFFGKNLGLAFQIIDDILDIESETKEKLTYPTIFGIEKSRKIAERLIDKAIISIKDLGENALPLVKIAEFVIERKY